MIYTLLYYLVPDLPRLLLRLFRVLQGLLLASFYLAVFGMFLTYAGLMNAVDRPGWGVFPFLFFLPLTGIIVGAYYAYQRDKQREALGLDDFSNNWLFFRYGHEVDYRRIAIPVKSHWGFKETQVSAQTMRVSLAENIADRLPVDNVRVMVRKLITDRQSGEQKEFTRIVIQSQYGSTVTVFIHYAAFGQTVTAHYFTYCRGTHDSWAVLRFLLASPFTIWFWILPWLYNKDSIIAKISEFRGSSFDSIDLQTMYEVAHRVIYEETAEILRQAGLLTEEIQNIINFNIQNVRSLQSVSINQSPNAVISGADLSVVEYGAQAQQPRAAGGRSQ
jgi:hypothetical protein